MAGDPPRPLRRPDQQKPRLDRLPSVRAGLFAACSACRLNCHSARSCGQMPFLRPVPRRADQIPEMGRLLPVQARVSLLVRGRSACHSRAIRQVSGPEPPRWHSPRADDGWRSRGCRCSRAIDGYWSSRSGWCPLISRQNVDCDMPPFAAAVVWSSPDSSQRPFRTPAWCRALKSARLVTGSPCHAFTPPTRRLMIGI